MFNNPLSVSSHQVNQDVRRLNAGRSVIDRHNHHRGSLLRKKLVRQRNPDIIILGSSHTANIHKAHLPHTDQTLLNLSVIGSGIASTIGIWQFIKQKKLLPKYIFIEEPSLLFTHFPSSSRLILPLKQEILQFQRQNPTINIEKAEENWLNLLFSSHYFKQNLRFIRFNFNALLRRQQVFPLINGAPHYALNNINLPSNHILSSINASDAATTYVGNRSIQEIMRRAVRHYEELLYVAPKTQINTINQSLSAILVQDMLNHGVEPIFILHPYNPITYNLLLKENNLLVTTEEQVRQFAEEHGITVVGSFNPQNYGLLATDFIDGNHPHAHAWVPVFKDFTFPTSSEAA